MPIQQNGSLILDNLLAAGRYAIPDFKRTYYKFLVGMHPQFQDLIEPFYMLAE
jgi:hypothetical protein